MSASKFDITTHWFETDSIIKLARDAGDAIMAIYQQEFQVYDKDDMSPLTEADLASHNILVQGLAKLTPEIPVLSEESSVQSERISWSRYWLLDPLDGTKEFIKKNGEFTVNIALIENGEAIFGVVYAPALDVLYWGGQESGAFKQIGLNTPTRIFVANPPVGDFPWKVVGSRSHQSEEFKSFVTCLPKTEIIAMGSSLKLCLVAEGKADLYPRLGLTSEWDTAAAQAVVEAAGGQVLEYSSLITLRYNSRPHTLLNPFFIVCARPVSVWSDSFGVNALG